MSDGSKEHWAVERAAMERWDVHPMDWPTPPFKLPRWWQFRARRIVADLEAVFGPIDDAALARFWQQRRLGQSVYEDVGGYLWRCYCAMCGLPIEEPYPYQQGISDLIESTP